jgi:hypothetical protein
MVVLSSPLPAVAGHTPCALLRQAEEDEIWIE